MWEQFLHALTHVWHNVEHALSHTWPLLPFLFALYIVMELIESKSDMQKVSKLGGKLGPLVGSATGLIPQCGFSVMAAKLFEQKYITIGTLFAIFMATSDEAFIILLSSATTDVNGAVWLLPMILSKIVIGIGVGYAVDWVWKLLGRKQVCFEMPKTLDGTPTNVHDIFIQRYQAEKDVEVNCSCGRQHGDDTAWKNYLWYPLLHTLKVGLFIFLVNFALEWIIHGVGGTAAFAGLMQKNRFLQPFITCAVGLIPNCASSVVLTETFLSGGITFGSCVAGLCVNAGMGFVVLLKNVRQWKRNLAMIGFCYAISVGIGLLINLIYPVFVSIV